MNLSKKEKNATDTGGIAVSIILIVVGVLAIWDTTNMVDADSFIFPRAVAIPMIVCCGLLIVLQWLNPHITSSGEQETSDGSSRKRLVLVGLLIAGCLAIVPLGFLLSSSLMFLAMMLLSIDYANLNYPKMIGLTSAAVLIVLGFYFVFAKLLQVPLPAAQIF